MDLSIVIAALDSAPDVESCLAALMPQTTGGEAIEVLLAANPGHAGVARVRGRWPELIILTADRPALVPELWGLGVCRARGRVVAVTISGCVPDPSWVYAILAAHRGCDAAVGGAIEQAAPAALVDWAVYFVRYTPYMLPFPDGSVAEVPGDNGTYKRAAIGQDLDIIKREGFWEVPENALLRARGESLRMDPTIIVRHTHSYGLGSFSRQRWVHGHRFGRARGARMGVGARCARVAAAPVTLAVLILRAGRELSRRRRHVGRFVLAMPLVAWFYGCWLSGEAAGLLAGPE